MMLKYVKKYENKRPVLLPTSQSSRIVEVGLHASVRSRGVYCTHIADSAYTTTIRELDAWLSVCDLKRGPGSKRLFLCTFCFYFMVAGFTHLLPIPEVDKLCDGVNWPR